MNPKPEITITGLFITFAILVFGSAMTGLAIFNQILMILSFIIVPAIILVILLRTVIKMPKSKIVENFKNQHPMTQLLETVTIISIISELIAIGSISFSAIPFLMLMIAIFCEWFFKKEENQS